MDFNLQFDEKYTCSIKTPIAFSVISASGNAFIRNANKCYKNTLFTGFHVLREGGRKELLLNFVHTSHLCCCEVQSLYFHLCSQLLNRSTAFILRHGTFCVQLIVLNCGRILIDIVSNIVVFQTFSVNE